MKGVSKAAVLTALVFTCRASVAKAQTVIGFDNLPPGTLVTNQYAAQGVEFGVTPFGSQGLGVKIVDLDTSNFKAAHSGTQVADISRTAEVSQTDIWSHFNPLREHVSFYLGSYYPGEHDVKLIAYDVNGKQIGQDDHKIPGHSGANTLFSVTSPTANIAYFEIIASPDDQHLLFIDDLSFDAPTGVVQPDFGINLLSLSGVWLVPGSSSVANLVLHRVNGSSGRVLFSVTGLPQGITSTFTPNPSLGGDGSLFNLSLTAAPGTISSEYTVTVTATALTTSAGTSPHSVQFQLMVGPSQVVSSPLTVTDVSPDSSFGDPANGATDAAGRIKSLVIDPTNDSILYAAGNTAGVWKSIDAGKTWQQASFGLRTGWTADDLSLAVDAHNPNRLLYATQANDGRNGQPFGGLWVSLDAAASWQHVDLPGCAAPTIYSTLFTSGQPLVATNCNIFTSTDSDLAHGQWQSLPKPPFAPAVVLQAQARTIFACPQGSAAVYRSVNLGSSWDPPVSLGPGNICYRIAAPSLAQVFQPSIVVVLHQQGNCPTAPNCSPPMEVSVIDFNTSVKQDLGFTPFAAADGNGGSGQPTVFTARKKNALPSESRQGFAYDIYAADGCAFHAFNPLPRPDLVPPWNKLQHGGGGGYCSSGSTGLHADSWSMAFPSAYDPVHGVCTAYAATDGGVFKTTTQVSQGLGGCLFGWVQAQSGLHVAWSGTMAGVSQKQSGAALYLPTGDDDVWATTDGGISWKSFSANLGDAGQTYIDPALPTREVSSRGGGGCQIAVTVSADGINPPSSSNVTNAGAKCFGPINDWSGIQPPNMSALSQVMTLASESPLSQGYYITVQSPLRNKCQNLQTQPCQLLAASSNPDGIVVSTQQDSDITDIVPSYWSDVSHFFGPGQVGGIATSGGITAPIIYVLTALDATYPAGSTVQAGQVWKCALPNGRVCNSNWTLASTGLNQARGLFVNPYNANELYVTDVVDNKIKASIDGGQHWLPQDVLTDIATNHGEFQFGCDTLSFGQGNVGDTCSLSGMAFDRQNPLIRVAAMYPGGLAFSRDGGTSWIELDVTNNVPRKCWLGPCSLAWDLVEYPQSVFYDSWPHPQTGYTSIYMALIGNSVKRVDGPFSTLQSLSFAVCETCLNLGSAFNRGVSSNVSAVFSDMKTAVPLTRGPDGVYRGQLLFDSAKFSKLAFHFVADGKSTPELSHPISAAEINSGATAWRAFNPCPSEWAALHVLQGQIAVLRDQLNDPAIPAAAKKDAGARMQALNKELGPAQEKLKGCVAPPRN